MRTGPTLWLMNSFSLNTLRNFADVTVTVRALSVAAQFALVDGNDAPTLPCKCDTLIKGDGRSVSIAAASIIAKVTRDRLMARLHDEHPGYNWKSNKGYGTPDHYSGLRLHGVTIHHRRSFGPIRNLLQGLDPTGQ